MFECEIKGCTVHQLAGRRAIPCGVDGAVYAIPEQAYGQCLSDLVAGFEAFLITNALNHNNGDIRDAAQDLGIKRQALDQILRGRHKGLDVVTIRRPRGRNKSDEPSATAES